jgi:hypothetical protein
VKVTGENITDEQIRELRLWTLQHAAGTDMPYACLRAMYKARSQRRTRAIARAVVAAAWNTWSVRHGGAS